MTLPTVFESSKSDVFDLYFFLQCVLGIATSLPCLWWFDSRLETIFATAPDASKNRNNLKSGQKWLENNILDLFNLYPRHILQEEQEVLILIALLAKLGRFEAATDFFKVNML